MPVAETVAHTEEKNTGNGFMVNPLFFSLFLFIFVFANYCVDRLGFSSSYQLVLAECLCPFRSALSRLTILQIRTDPFPEISIFSGQNPALQLCAHAYAVTACGPVAFSYFRIHSKNRVKVYIPNSSFWVVKLVVCCGSGFVTGKTSVLKQCIFLACHELTGT